MTTDDGSNHDARTMGPDDDSHAKRSNANGSQYLCRIFMSEWGRSKGTDFEQSIAAMLTYHGFKIVVENISIKCLDPSDHKTTEHSIDFLAEHDASVPRLFKSYDGLTFFDCTSREEVTETQFMKASQTLKCLRRTDPYAGMSGSIVVTARRMTPQLREDLNKHSDIMCWDLDHVSLYGALARTYVLSTERNCYGEPRPAEESRSEAS